MRTKAVRTKAVKGRLETSTLEGTATLETARAAVLRITSVSICYRTME